MMNNIRYKLQNFMKDRYGVDTLGMFLVCCVLAINLIESFTGIVYFSIISFTLLVFAIYRIFSKNIVKRRIENDKYNTMMIILKRYWKVLKNNITDKSYRYYLCPDCHQMVRVPKGHGKVIVTCPNCHKKFEKRS